MGVSKSQQLNGIFFLLQITNAFYVPGILPKSYTYNNELPISMSSKLTSEVPHQLSFSSKKTDRKEVHIAHDTLIEYDFCDPSDGFELYKVKHSSTIGYFSEEIINSAYTVDLLNARPSIEVAGQEGKEPGSLPAQEGVAVCKKLCTKYWDLKKVIRFSSLVQHDYGYRLFVDDLPSATVLEGQTHYEWTVPLGYTPDPSELDTDSQWTQQKVFKPVAVYNHLEIKVKVHPTIKSNLLGSTTQPSSINVKVPTDVSKYLSDKGVKIPNNITVDLPNSQELRIVGFEVTPKSIANAWACEKGVDFSKVGNQILIPDQAIHFSYSLVIEHSNKDWPNRLDHYVNFGKSKLYWEQLIASGTVLIFASLLFICVMNSALERDDDVIKFMRAQYRTSRFNTARSRFLRSGPNYQPIGPAPDSRQNIDPSAPLRREVAWKKLSADIFRKPARPMLLSAFFGTGLQIFAMAVVVFFTSIAGTYSPINLTIIKSMAVLSFFVCGIVNGFAAGRLYAFFHGRDWVGLTFLTAITYPSIVASGLLIIDICEFAETLRFTTLTLPEGFIMSLMFLLINIPSNWLGVFIGYKMTPIKTPTKVSRVPRDPPAQLPWFLGFSLSGIIAGGVPVFVIVFELYQIWQCVKGSGYINLVFITFYFACIIFIIVVAQISVMQTYILMCYEEYRWWWRCWALGASTGFFTIWLLINQFILALKVSNGTTLIVYSICAGLFSLSLGLMTGSIALLSSLLFNIQIFRKIKHQD